jgi:hypothetical protein
MEMSYSLQQLLPDFEVGLVSEPEDIAGLWAAATDARNLVILGDPAVRLNLEE